MPSGAGPSTATAACGSSAITRTVQFKRCQHLIRVYIVGLTQIQDQMFDHCGETAEDREFFDEGFYDTTSMECHQRLCAQFAKCHGQPLAANIEQLIAAWRQIVSTFRETLDAESTNDCVHLIKYIIGFCLLEARFFEALHCLCELISLNVGDYTAWLLLALWTLRLEEWTLLERILLIERLAHTTIPPGYSLVMDCVRMAHRLHTAESATEQHTIGAETKAKLDELIGQGKRTYLAMQARAVLRAALVTATRVPKADLQKLDDPLLHREQELARHYGILSSRHPDLFQSNRSSTIRQKLSDSGDFVLFCSSYAEYQETAHTFTWELIELGLIREAESSSITLWRDCLAFGVPFWTIRPLVLLFHIKSLTGLEALDGYANCLNALLTPPTASKNRYLHTPKKPIRPSSYRRGSAVDDSFERRLLTSTIVDGGGTLEALLMLELSSVNLHQEDAEERNRQFRLEEHVPGCSCSFCALRSRSWLFALEMLWLSLLFGRHLPDKFNQFRRQMNTLRICAQRLKLVKCVFSSKKFSEEFYKEQAELEPPKRKRGRPPTRNGRTQKKEVVVVENISSEKENNSMPNNKRDTTNMLMEMAQRHLPFHYCAPFIRSSVRLLLTRWDELGTTDQHKRYIREAHELAIQSPLSFRPYWLLLKHFARQCSPSSPMDLLKSAYEDQKNYGHLLFCEWLRRNCQFLVRSFGTQGLSQWHRALYQFEASTPSLRQMARLNCRKKAARQQIMQEISSPSSSAGGKQQSNETANQFIFENSDQLRAAIGRLPENLTLINLTLEEDDTLTLTRCHCSHEPIVISICRVTKQDPILERMRELLLASDESVICAGTDQRQFWARRKQLDDEMKKFVGLFQKKWLSTAAPLFLPLPLKTPTEAAAELRRLQRTLVAEFGLVKTSALTIVRLMDLMANENEWIGLVKLLYANDHRPQAEDITEQQQQMILPEKLEQLLQQCWQNVRTKTESGRAERRAVKKYTLLVIPPTLSHLPWECLPIYRRAPLVSRIPCFHLFDHLCTHIKNIPKPVDGRNSYYVLNPSGDLDKTEERLSTFMQQFRWRGLVGQVPTKEQLQNALAEHDLFLYMGHGSGGRYFGRSCVRESECRAVSVLMGCSSVRIIDEGAAYDGRSSVYEYLIAQSPCIIGCLWMVTDGEIDRFFMALVEYCFAALIKPSGEEEEERQAGNGYVATLRLLIEGVVEARRRSKLPYLTGAAVVAYGLPIAAQCFDGAKLAVEEIDDDGKIDKNN